MKKMLLISGLFAAFLCLAQSAHAQYVPQIHRDGADFVDQAGRTLSDQDLIGLVGDEVYFDTVVGARRQYNAGRKLFIGGAIGMGIGLTSIIGGAFLIADSGGVERSKYFDSDQVRHDYGDDSGAMAGAALFIGGYVATIVGGGALTVGLPLSIIGKSRLNWVENDYNNRSREASLRFGYAPSGVGVTLQF